MKTLMQVAQQNQNWLMKWVFFPIVAYYASWILGLFWLMPLVFSVLLVGIQWKQIKRLTGNSAAGLWWLSLFLYLFVAWVVCEVPAAYVSWLGDSGVVRCALTYFGTQAIGELVISQLVTSWRWGRFALANALAAGCWLGVSFLINWLAAGRWNANELSGLWIGVGIPALGALGNVITGIGLLAAVGDGLTSEQSEQTYEVGYVDQD